MNKHQISTVLLFAVICVGFGYYLRDLQQPTFSNVAQIERRLREVVCETIVHNQVSKTCDPTFPRYYND